MEPERLGWEPTFNSWLDSLPAPLVEGNKRDTLFNLFDGFVPPCLVFLRENVKELVPTSDTMLVKGECEGLYLLFLEFFGMCEW